MFRRIPLFLLLLLVVLAVLAPKIIKKLGNEAPSKAVALRVAKQALPIVAAGNPVAAAAGAKLIATAEKSLAPHPAAGHEKQHAARKQVNEDEKQPTPPEIEEQPAR